MPHPSAAPRHGGVVPLSRLTDVLASRTGRRVVAALNVLVLVLAVGPFVLWEGVGPARFGDVDLGEVPGGSLDAGEPLADPVDPGPTGWVGELPYDLSPTTTVTLVFSVGSRGMATEEADRLRVHDVDERGRDGLTDTMMLVVADRASRQVALLSLPRDLWVDARGHRINATFNRHGLQAFVDDVATATGLPIHHLVQLNFGAFARLVDAVGGVAVHVGRPLADVPAVLYVPEPGCWLFDGATALAWSRGRHTLTRDADGDWVHDRTASDFGRIERQQALLGALWDQVRRPGTITSLPEVIGVARDGMVVDEDLGLQQVRDLLAVFGEVAAGTVEGYTYPTRGQRISGAAAQVAVPEDATPILTRLRTWPPDPSEPAPGAAASPIPAPATGTVLAAATTLALPDAPPCSRAEAMALPDPRPHLGGVVASRGGSSGMEDGAPGGDVETADASDDEADQDDAPPPEPAPEDTGPEEPPPSESDGSSEEPTDGDDEDDDGPLPIPLPGDD